MNTVKIRTELSREYIRPGRQTVYLMVEIMTGESKADGERLPVNIGFVLDRSGSMAGEKLAYTKQAVSYAVGHLRPVDFASLTIYDNEVETLLEAQHIVSKDAFKGTVSRIFPGGCTNLSGGLIAGYREVMKHNKSEQLNRVLLLTDGLANEGITDKAVLCNKVKQMKKTGVTVTTLGVGDDFDEDLLTTMAEVSGGNYYFIENSDEIPQIFAKELQALLSVVAQNVKLQFSSSQACAVTKVWGYQPVGDRVLSIHLPDLFSCDSKFILLEMQLHSETEGNQPLGRLTLSYDEAGEDLKCVTCDIDLAVQVTDDKSMLAIPDKPEVLVQLELNRSADIKEEAIRLADSGDVKGAASLLHKQKNAIQDAMNVAFAEDCAELQGEYEKLSEAMISLERNEYDPIMRKKMSYQSYQRRNSRK